MKHAPGCIGPFAISEEFGSQSVTGVMDSWSGAGALLLLSLTMEPQQTERWAWAALLDLAWYRDSLQDGALGLEPDPLLDPGLCLGVGFRGH